MVLGGKPQAVLGQKNKNKIKTKTKMYEKRVEKKKKKINRFCLR